MGKALHNRVNRRELKEKLQHSAEVRITLSFYKYVHIADPQDFRDRMYRAFSEIGVLGRIYVACEGVNAQLSVPEAHFAAFRSVMDSFGIFEHLRLNIAVEDTGKSFFALIIKTRSKIVADGISDPNFDSSKIGEHLDAAAFNRLTDDPNTILVDMRNHYESEVGHFKGAILPSATTFREELPLVAGMLEEQKDKNVVMYCTGGIRCEKASAYLKYKGFKNVYQLEGGIIEYTRQAKRNGLPNKFIGKNFVFDERLAERISDEVIAHCHQCGKPADTHINCANTRCHLLFIQCETCRQRYEGCCSGQCQTFHALPAEEQKARASQYEFNGSKFGKAHYTVLKGALMCFILFLGLACQFFGPLETVETKDDKGMLERYERRKKDYAKEGKYEKFYADGKKYVEARYVNDSLDGERRFFYASGQLETVETYVRGVYHGPYRHYHENGKLQLEQVYVKGALQGMSKRYYPSGILADEAMLVDNEENGVFTEYYENGQKKAEGYYTPGDGESGPWEQGELKEYDESGTLVRIASCQDGRCETKWTKEGQ